MSPLGTPATTAKAYGRENVPESGGVIPAMNHLSTSRTGIARLSLATNVPALHAATDAIMAEVTELVGQLRGRTPPPVPYDPAPLTRLPSVSVGSGGGSRPDAPRAGS